MSDYAAHYAKRGPTPQTQPIPGREKEQVENNAGGFVFAVGDWSQLDRFLILGSEGSYYAGPRAMTIDNAKAVERCIKEDGGRTVARIVEISDAGRAPKNDPALFALALCAAAEDVATRRAALAALPLVARIGTHLFQFAGYVQAQRGWGRALRRAVGDWYNLQPVDRIAYQAVKYQQREGWSNRDLLRLSHPVTTDSVRKAVYDWICGRKVDTMNRDLPRILGSFESLKSTPNAPTAVANIRTFNLPREAIPTELLNEPSVWQALLEDMPLMAMIRNLGKMTSIGVLAPFKPEVAKVVEALWNITDIRKSRVHPIAILMALKTYSQGHGEKGKLTWTPVPQIVDALNGAFYLAFANVEPTGKNILLALDVSNSMGSAVLAGSSLTAREVSAAMALVIAATEPNYLMTCFATTFAVLNITPKMRLDEVVRAVSNIPFGGTDCSLPWVAALKENWAVDAVVTITDNETYQGRIHVSEAAAEYRKKTGIAARSIVIGTTSTGFTVNDPNDPLGLDVVGFDTAVPALVSDFIRG